MAFTEDLSVFFDLNGFGVPVTAGAVSGVGILDQNSELILDREIAIIDYLLTVPTVTFGSLGQGDAITVDGQLYKVEIRPQRFDDGTLCRMPLIKNVATRLCLLLESSIMLDSTTTSGNIDGYIGVGTIDSLTGIGPMALLLENGDPLLLEP
jgi:hypothetical protein